MERLLHRSQARSFHPLHVVLSIYVAKEYLGLEVEEREVYFDEVKDFAECGLCGTAAVISPVGKIVDHGKEICLPSGMDEMGPVTKKLYETLTGIQMGQHRGSGRDGFTEFCKIYELIANKKKVQKCIFFLFFPENKQHITVDNSRLLLYTVCTRRRYSEVDYK